MHHGEESCGARAKLPSVFCADACIQSSSASTVQHTDRRALLTSLLHGHTAIVQQHELGNKQWKPFLRVVTVLYNPLYSVVFLGIV